MELFLMENANFEKEKQLPVFLDKNLKRKNLKDKQNVANSNKTGFFNNMYSKGKFFF